MSAMQSLDLCLACHSPLPSRIVNFGKQPPANAVHDNTEELPEFPLALKFCEHCSHLQLSHAVDPSLLFSHYLYVSGTTSTLREHFNWIYTQVTETCPRGRVLDIGCNDGTQLEVFQSHGWDVIGVDPASNLAERCHKKQIPVIVDFWGTRAAAQVGKVSCIIAQNVFAHTSHVDEFLEACQNVLEDGGRLYIQTSQADMVRNNEFDTIYHEHISYFTIKSMLALTHRLGWTIEKISKPAIHGTSFLFELQYHHEGVYFRPTVYEQYCEEFSTGVHFPRRLREYAATIDTTREWLDNELAIWTKRGYHIIAYGATAKSMTILNSLERNHINCFIDENPLKQGKFTPHHNVPIVAPDYTLPPRTLIVMTAWNFAAEVLEKLRHRSDVTPDTQILYYAPTPKVETLL
jgi:cyclopropane fatty-acyl-phospholipid synthase-like methyltransferase